MGSMPKRRSRRAEMEVKGKEAPVMYRISLKMKPERKTERRKTVIVAMIWDEYIETDLRR